MVIFEKCDSTNSTQEFECWEEGKINEWLAFKYIITLTNEKRFV